MFYAAIFLQFFTFETVYLATPQRLAILFENNEFAEVLYVRSRGLSGLAHFGPKVEQIGTKWDESETVSKNALKTFL